ncbi:ParA family protein [Sedimenticola selenatireducens]|uniref:ParA family protein n=1 Tax=Sedimenticola selenatireducens TaxID=191960 RepID=A0A558DPB9_9GAMM|nr:ParA family protein [Sedimenticola selenatireducens]TVO78325.1 ParA family protein [Sedimenticola selenatireducens]TVT62817.1 MAG: ParA family protein [Sedimenticola selenatireducens]
MQTLAIFNPHPKVGKTTFCVNFGHALALAGQQVTLIDFDPNGMLCDCLGLFRPPSQGIDQVLMGKAKLEAVSVSTRDEMHVVPGGNMLSELASGALSDMEKGLLLQRILLTEPLDQDYLIFDCPSTSDLLVANALLAVDRVIIPLAGDEQGANSLPHLLETVQRFGKARGRPLYYNIVMNRIPARRRLTGVAASKFSALAPGHFLKTVVCLSLQLTEAQKIGRTIFEYRPHSRSASDFRQLAAEYIKQDVCVDG